MLARALPDGGTIGVPSPSSPYENRSEIDRGVRWWESRGYKVKLGSGIHERSDYVAGDPNTRARDLNELFADPEVDVVQAHRGGYGASQVVPLLDYDVIGANPKPFVGYSDITALHVAIRQRTGLVTFYGPGLTSMGNAKKEWTKDRALRALTATVALGEVPRRQEDPYVGALNSGRATAPLVGGCLWLLRETLATPWEVGVDGCILFFEDVHCPPWHLDGMLTQLRNAGKLEQVAGIAIGEFAESDPTKEKDPWLRSKSFEDVIEEQLEPLGIPIVFNLPLGHGEQICTIPLGVAATVDADARMLTIDEPALVGAETPAKEEAAVSS